MSSSPGNSTFFYNFFINSSFLCLLVSCHLQDTCVLSYSYDTTHLDSLVGSKVGHWNISAAVGFSSSDIFCKTKCTFWTSLALLVLCKKEFFMSQNLSLSFKLNSTEYLGILRLVGQWDFLVLTSSVKLNVLCELHW